MICCRKYLDPGFSEVNSKRQFLAAEYVGIVGLLEHIFQLIQLEAGERRAIATLFALRRLMLSISFASHICLFVQTELSDVVIFSH